MRIELNKKADQGLGGILTLRPGLNNNVDPALWEKAKAHSMTRWFLDQGIIRVLGETGPSRLKVSENIYVAPEVIEQEPEIVTAPPKDLARHAPADRAPPASLASMHARQAVAAVAKMDNAEMLMEMLEDESRKSVIEAIEARLDHLTKGS